MAANIIRYDKQTDYTRVFTGALRKIREGLEDLAKARAALIQTRDGDGSSASHYDLTATLGGYLAGDYADAPTAAKASFDELDSLYAKLSVDSSVSFVNAAIYQACAKHGV